MHCYAVNAITKYKEMIPYFDERYDCRQNGSNSNTHHTLKWFGHERTKIICPKSHALNTYNSK